MLYLKVLMLGGWKGRKKEKGWKGKAMFSCINFCSWFFHPTQVSLFLHMTLLKRTMPLAPSLTREWAKRHPPFKSHHPSKFNRNTHIQYTHTHVKNWYLIDIRCLAHYNLLCSRLLRICLLISTYVWQCLG